MSGTDITTSATTREAAVMADPKVTYRTAPPSSPPTIYVVEPHEPTPREDGD